MAQVRRGVVRLAHLTALPAEDLEVEERKCCHKVLALSYSGQGGLRIVCTVRFTGLITMVISHALERRVVLEADTLE